MKIKQIECKTALSPSRLPGLDYSLNPYRGCQHNCVYCYAPAILRCQRSRWGSEIFVKRNIPRVLSNELHRKKPGVVALSTVTDPYQPVEQKFQLTRYCLEQLVQHEFPVHLQTKNQFILRDTDLISRLSDVEVMVSIGTLHDQERKLLEPGSSSIADRFKVLKHFTDRGIKASVFLGPIYPTVTSSDVRSMLLQFKEVGVSDVMIDTLHFRPGVYEALKVSLQNYPELQKRFLLKNSDKTRLYNQIRKTILFEAQQLNLRISDAF